jgi:hypothetical protein
LHFALHPAPNNPSNPARAFFFRSIRGQHVEVHRRAQTDVVDLSFRHSSQEQLISVGEGDI